MNLQDQFLQLALLGANWVLWVLMGLSFAAVAIVIERVIFYRGIGRSDGALLEPLNAAIADRDWSKAESLVKAARGPGAAMVRSMLRARDRGETALAAILDAVRGEERLRMERNVSFLGTVGSNAPFIGLFGTVLEILRVFNQLGEEGVTSGKEAAGIMTGISEALVATGVGLLVAIPAVIAYNAFQRKLKRMMTEGEGLAKMALSQMVATPSEGKGD